MPRLLQLSDLHFHTRPNKVGMPENLRAIWDAPTLREKLHLLVTSSPLGSYSPELANAAKVFIAENAASLDGIIITGDLSTSGAQEDLTLASNWINALPFKGPISVMPGNHDRFGAEKDLFPLPSRQSLVRSSLPDLDL